MQKKTLFRWFVLTGFALASGAWALTCPAVTPESAARQWERAQQRAESFESKDAASSDVASGYRVERVMSDATLHAQWALISDCAHPARPWIAVRIPMTVIPRVAPIAALSGVAQPFISKEFSALLSEYIPVQVHAATTAGVSAVSATLSPILVHAGDRVVLWNQEPELRLAIAAVSLEYGHAGQIIHLRRDSANTMQNVTITGVVRGPGSVELMP